MSIYFLILLIKVKRFLPTLIHFLLVLRPFTHLDLLPILHFSLLLPPIDIETTLNDGPQILDWV